MKKGQFWYGDFLVGVIMLMIIGFLFVNSLVDISSRNEVMEELILDASDISSLLMGQGIGDLGDWVNGEGTIGFVKDHKLDFFSLDFFLHDLNYNEQRRLLGTFNHVWIYLANREGDIVQGASNGNLRGIGHINDIDADNIVSVKRFVFYDGDIHVLGVVVWK